ncbi:hypothetical protein D9619_008826 [Psilocybe cf. subviscida]|uniref:Uncharacterized protein n=1 Tax=Psilocybe cf. subviscida TaxID=2480587 RepID=A0A8H5BAL1_9AGAR|nr:hypothetical protein D9619_008826 [Psilocybe cf. subviscida]
MSVSIFYLLNLIIRLTAAKQVESLLLACISIMIQMFFCWRIWIFSAASFGIKSRICCTVVPAILALFSFGTYIDLAINGFNHRILTGNTPDFVQAFKLATCSQIAYDVLVTSMMTWNLQRARVGIRSLNAREYLREKFDNNPPSIVYPEFVASPNHALSEETTTGLYELSTTDHTKVELPTVA